MRLTGPPPQLTVYVSYHDSRPHPQPGQRPYVALCNVRRDGSRPPGFAAYDDEGGWPDRNAAYCELSALRHLEQHADTEFVGLFHYRRALAARRPKGGRAAGPGSWSVPDWDWSDAASRGAGEADLVAAALTADWLTPRPYDVRRAGFASLWEQFTHNHPEYLLELAGDAVAEQAPLGLSFAQYMREETSTPLYNVFLGRRVVLLQYTAFLWPVLERCAQAVRREPDHYQGRWAGFLAERLHGYWLTHGAAAPRRVAHLPLLVLDREGIRNGTQVSQHDGVPGDVAASWSSGMVAYAPPRLTLMAHRGRRWIRSAGPQ